MSWNEKQKPRRIGQYAAMLIMLLTIGVGQMWAGASWIGNSFIVVGSTWYNASGTGQSNSFNGANLGKISSLNLGGEIQSYGQSDGAGNPARMHYKFDDGSSTYITLYWFKYANNNNYFHSNSNGSTSSGNAFATKSISLSGLAAGSHKLKVWFEQPDGSQWDSNEGSNYVADFTLNPVVTFNANGGSGSMSAQTVTYNTATALNSNSFTKDGWTFAGWATASDGAVVYTNGANVTLTAHTTLYAKWTQDPTITLTSVSPSSSIVAGNDITLVGTRANSSNTISFQYTTDDGANWTDITPKTTSGNSPKTITWTVPDAHGATQTFKFRAKLAEATPIYSSKSSGVSVYNTKTFKLKNEKSWSDLYLYAYNGSGDLLGSFPGINSTSSKGFSINKITNSGLWWNVTITSECTYYIVSNGSSGSGNQTTDITYGTYSDGGSYGCYNTSDGLFYTRSGGSALSAPSVSTSSVTPTVNNAATIGGNVTGLGNDWVTSYGYYYSSTNSSLSGSNLTGATKVQVGTNKNATGTYSKSQTGLTGGTTYYVIAYATNGHSTVYGSRVSFTTPYKVTISNPATGGTFSSTGDKYVSSTLSVTCTAAEGYTFNSWTASGCSMTSTSTTSGVTTATLTPSADNATLTAVYDEDMHTVTVTTDGHGTITTPASGSPRTVSAGIATGGSIAVSASTGYTFYNWTKTSGSGTVTFTNANANSTTVKATSDATVRANFVDMWNVKGSWDSWAAYEPMTATGVSNTYSATKTLAAKTEYHIKVVKRVDNNSSNDKWYGVNGGTTLSRATGSVTGLEENGGGDEYITFTTDAAGDYTITYLYNASVGSMKVTVGYPEAYTITYGVGTINGSSTDISVSPSFTSGDYVLPETDVTFSKGSTNSGYTWKGWYSNVGGTGDAWSTTDASLSLTATRTGNISVYACYNYATYTATLSTTGCTGYGSGAPANQTATYTQAMPTITPPTAANGYCFMGYWDDEEGEGTQYYNANGTSAHAWDKTSGATLYAYFKKAEFTTLEHNSTVAKGDVVTLDVNPVLNVTPADYTAICWTLHYSENDNEVATSGASYYSVASYSEGGSKPNQVRFTLNNLAVGSYYVKAVLKAKATSFTDVCDAEESGVSVIDTETGEFSIIGSSKVTIRYRDLTSSEDIAPSGSVEIEAGGNADVKAPKIIGYTFNSWSVGAGVTDNGHVGDSINISSPYDGVITAFYTKKNMIYFNNANVNWDTVYVYFYSSDKYWNDSKGTGAKWDEQFPTDKDATHKPHYYHFWGGMTRIGGSNVYYFDYEDSIANASWNSEIRGYTNVAFTDKPQGYGYGDGKKGYQYFYDDAKVARRGDFAHSKSMFVPLAEPTTLKNSDKATYYDEGYWMNYPDDTGYELKIFNKRTRADEPYADSMDPYCIKTIKIPFGAGNKLPASVTVDLEAGKTYGFKIYRADGQWYGNNGTMTNGHSGDGNQGVWEFKTDKENAGLTTTSAGNYTFTLSYGLDAVTPTPGYNYLVGVRYPESTGDFRVQYKDDVKSTWKTSVVIPLVTEQDTVSYFVRHSSSPYIRVQQCTATWDGSSTTVTWSTIGEGTGTDILPDTISADGVYNFIFTKDGEENLVLSAVEPYTGNFYIRTKGAGSTGWDNYRAADHIMPFSEYSFSQTTNPYSHYFTKYYRTKTDQGADLDPIDITFVVANDYSTNISDTITRDGIANAYVDASGNFSGTNANIRFMYDYKTNEATRRYLDDAQGPRSEDYLLLIPSNNTSIYNAQTEGSAYTQVKLEDKGNWIYEANVYVVPGTTYKLKAQFGRGENIVTQYLKGAASGVGEYETLIGGTTGSRLNIRLIYDYKTNRVIAAYLPSGTIDTNLEINADIMFVREDQGNVTEISFGENTSISEIKEVYTSLKFNKSTITDPGRSRYERDLYHVSFPYDVRVSDIIGFGTYGTHWIIEYYDGAARAEKGFWADSKSFWTFVTPDKASSFIMKAGTGYIVALDLDEMELGDPIWENVSSVELIFPGSVDSISNRTVKYTLPKHQCNIGPRFEGGDDRRIKDSHWNIMGVPVYHNTNGTFENHDDEIGGKSQVWSADGKPNYLYTWNMTDNSITPTNASGYTYKAMQAYIVQYYGDVTFTTSASPAPSSIAARTYAEAPRSVDFRLEIQQNETTIDQTFVQLSDEEGVSSEFVFGEDMSKEFNKNKANIYTMISSILNDTATVTEAAGNTLPMSEQTTIIPVGVKIATDGEYTFAISDGTSGVGVTLIDNVANTRTNLGLTDYTVNLNAGTIDGRFILEISPISQNPTDVELINGENGANGVRKVIIDQKMYIIRGNEIFDARGAKVK